MGRSVKLFYSCKNQEMLANDLLKFTSQGETKKIMAKNNDNRQKGHVQHPTYCASEG